MSEFSIKRDLCIDLFAITQNYILRSQTADNFAEEAISVEALVREAYVFREITRDAGREDIFEHLDFDFYVFWYAFYCEIRRIGGFRLEEIDWKRVEKKYLSDISVSDS